MLNGVCEIKLSVLTSCGLEWLTETGGFSAVIEHLLALCKALCRVLSTATKKKGKDEEGVITEMACDSIHCKVVILNAKNHGFHP